ncbi:hypothetical protein E5288_WYG021089 [Bos mutus]|uniref:C-type lectin domain-containing protein n=1 Tax=Bos mutus TaxID=72004 RepID=A0A6B0RTU4_9CETA|nr:hypothetical protein [Bos mutus]
MTKQVQEEVNEKESSCESCPKTWKAFQGFCYNFCPDELPWLKAMGCCAEEGARLVIINSQAEQEFLSPKRDVTYWIGLRKQSSIDIYKWQVYKPPPSFWCIVICASSTKHCAS